MCFCHHRVYAFIDVLQWESDKKSSCYTIHFHNENKTFNVDLFIFLNYTQIIHEISK